MSLAMPEELIVFECPYCQRKHNLTRLIAAGYIRELISIFTCWDRWSKDGCEEEFLLKLEHFYKANMSKIKLEPFYNTDTQK